MKIHAFAFLLCVGLPAFAAGEGSDCYRDGKLVRAIIAPAGDDGYRLISMGVYSYNDADGAQDQIEIYDISEPPRIYGRSFAVCAGPFERRIFPLKDGLSRFYVLGIDGCGKNIRFGRPGNEDQIETDYAKLLLLRANYAIANGEVISFPDGNDYLAIPQCGENHQGLVLFQDDLRERIAQQGYVAAFPDFFVETMERDGSSWKRKDAPIKISRKSGREYELYYDASQGWVARDATNEDSESE